MTRIRHEFELILKFLTDAPVYQELFQGSLSLCPWQWWSVCLHIQLFWDISWKGDWHFASSSGPSGEIVHLIQFLQRSEFMCESWNEMHLLYIHSGFGNANVDSMQKMAFDKVQLTYEIIFLYSSKEKFDKILCLVFQRATECHLHRQHMLCHQQMEVLSIFTHHCHFKNPL